MLRWRLPPPTNAALMADILENRRLMKTMTDALTTAVADLAASVTTLQAQVSSATADISSLLQQLLNAAGTGLTQEMTDAAAAIEARVGDINAASTALGDAVATPQPAPSPGVSTSLSDTLSSGVSTSLSTTLSTGVSTSLSASV